MTTATAPSAQQTKALNELRNAAAQSKASRNGPGAAAMSSPSGRNANPLSEPVWYYNSKFPNEVYTRPDDPNKIDPEVMRFVNGQFCATKEWQKDVLERQPHVYPEDIGIEAIDPCPQCGYKTGSYKDMQAHYRSHM